MLAIDVVNVKKIYKNGIQALDGISLSVKTGEIFSLLGQNGAGKSTLIGILTTYLKADSGEVIILGDNIASSLMKVRNNIACVAQRISIDKNLSLRENMMFQADLYKIPKDEAKKRMEILIAEFELSQYLKYPVSSYSGGIKRRLDIALNMMSNPKILFLDEPTVGMDIQSRMAMWQMLKKIRDNFSTTIFLTTHYLEEADNLSNTICIMKDGKEVIQGSPLELRKFINQKKIEISFVDREQAKDNFAILKENLPRTGYILKNNSILIETTSGKQDFIGINKFLLNSKIDFKGIEISDPTLEDVFLRLTERKEE